MSLEPRIAERLAASGARIVVTGAGGWLGMASLELLKAALGEDFERRTACFGSRRRALRLSDGTMIEQQPLEVLAALERRPTIVLHLAFLTKDRAEAMDEQAYASECRRIGETLLGALDAIGAEALFLASSGAARFADDPAAAPAMRLYGRLKREDEERFADWAGRTGKRAVIARIFNLSGPHINKHGSYALASFILDALAGRPITVRAGHPVVRGYVAIRELMSLALALLLEPGGGVVRFDSGGEPVELGELAETVRRAIGGGPVERPAMSAAPADRYAGDEPAYRALLQSHGLAPVPLAQQIAETAEFLGDFQSLSSPNRVEMGAQPC